MQKGHFIVLEGCDGCGKGTQLKRLAKYLEEKCIAYTTVREPGSTELGEFVRNLLKNPNNNLTPDAQLVLLYASRMTLIYEIIKPALEKGNVVLTDRYDHSTFAYQVYAQGANIKAYKILSNKIIRPDLVLILDVDNVEETLKRAKKVSNNRDWFENQNLDFHIKVRDGYRKLFELNKKSNSKEKLILVPEGIIEEVWQKIRKYFDGYIDTNYKKRNP